MYKGLRIKAIDIDNSTVKVFRKYNPTGLKHDETLIKFGWRWELGKIETLKIIKKYAQGLKIKIVIWIRRYRE